MKNYDLAIVGMGFAGYTGAIYAARYGLKTVIFGDNFGGQTAEAHIIGNYPGFEEITGMELMQKVQQQTIKLGVEEIYSKVAKIEKNSEEKYPFTLTTEQNEQIKAKNILLTIGMKRKKLHVTGEAEFYGKGVTYCATCDGAFFKGKEVAVVGGGDSAVTAALFLSELCTTVHLLVRSDKLRAEPYWIKKLEEKSNIKVHFSTQIQEITGNQVVEKLILSGTITELSIQGVFIEIGHEPITELTTDLGIQLDDHGFIIVDKEQRTSVPGILAAGDSTTASNKFAQLVTAAAEAAIAVESIASKG